MRSLALHRWIVPYLTSASLFPGPPLLMNGFGPPSESPHPASIDGRMTSVCATAQKMGFPVHHHCRCLGNPNRSNPFLFRDNRYVGKANLT